MNTPSRAKIKMMLSALVILIADNSMALAQGEGTPYSINITGKAEGPYNLRATVKAPDKPATLSDSQSKKKPGADDSLLNSVGGFAEFEKIISGRKTPAEERDAQIEAMQKAMKQQEKMMKDYSEQMTKAMEAMKKNQANKPASVGSSPTTTSSSEDHHHNLPTDGSPNSQAITGSAINSFYEGLPPQVTDYLSGNSGINLSGSDPYVDYAKALQSSDFARMRQLANSQDIEDFNQRIAMLGLAGAAALNSMANPNNTNNFAAKDTLRKVAEDLQYAGQGLDQNKPNDAKLKAICEDISRIWGNMTKPPK